MLQAARCWQQGEFRPCARPRRPLRRDTNCPHSIPSAGSTFPRPGQGNRWMPEGTVLPGRRGSVLLCRSAARDLSGRDGGFVLGLNVAAVLAPERSSAFQLVLADPRSARAGGRSTRHGRGALGVAWGAGARWSPAPRSDRCLSPQCGSASCSRCWASSLSPRTPLPTWTVC